MKQSGRSEMIMVNDCPLELREYAKRLEERPLRPPSEADAGSGMTRLHGSPARKRAFVGNRDTAYGWSR